MPYRLRSKSLKSLSDVTVAPVAPTERSAHCSQNELHTGYYHCLAPTGNSLSFFSRLLFLLKRISNDVLFHGAAIKVFSFDCMRLL
jgi:hypothetical protein